MLKRRYEQREPTHDWQQIRPFLKDSAQITYEVIRPCILGWETSKERAAETGMPMSSIYYKANLFDQAGMASLLPPAPPPEIPKQDKRSLPPHIRQEIVDLHTQYPAFRPHEIATICFVKFNRKPAPATIKLILASGPKPSTTERRHPRYAEIENGKERRRLVIRLHVDGWNAKSIVGYVDVSRKTVHEILQRFAEEQFAGLEDTSHAHKKLRKVTIQTIQEIKKLSENPLLGAYRVSAALEQMGIKLSRATCGRYLSINRGLYHLQMPRRPRPKAAMPFKAERRHQIWSVDIRYLDMHSLHGIEMVYCISILENFSRSILASAISVRQDTEAFFAVFYAAVRRYGVPEMLVLEYEQEKLSRYSVEWQLDKRHLARVGNPRFYRHPYQSPQQELWQPGEVEWFVIIHNAPPVGRRKRKSRLVLMQLPLLLDGTRG